MVEDGEGSAMRCTCCHSGRIIVSRWGIGRCDRCGATYDAALLDLMRAGAHFDARPARKVHKVGVSVSAVADGKDADAK